MTKTWTLFYSGYCTCTVIFCLSFYFLQFFLSVWVCLWNLLVFLGASSTLSFHLSVFFLLSICSLSVLSFFRGFGCWFHQSDGVFISLFFRSDIFFSPLAFLSALLLLRVFQQLAFPYAFTYIRPVAISGLVSVC